MGYAAVGLPYYSPNWGEYGPPPKFPDLPGSFIDIRVDQIAELRRFDDPTDKAQNGWA